MKIAVLVKMVADSSLKEIKISEDGTKIMEDLGINPFDMYGLEQALLVQAQLKGKENVEIFSLTLGPESLKNKVREPLNFGLNKAILIKDDEGKFGELLETSRLIASVLLDREKPDIVFCGAKAIDKGSGLVPVMVAKILNMPVLTNIKTFTLNYETKTAKVSRMEEDKEVFYEVRLPAVFSCEKGLNKPRASGGMQNIIAAKKKPLEILNQTEIFPINELTAFKKSCKYERPLKRKAGQVLKGLSVKEAAEKIREALKNGGVK